MVKIYMYIGLPHVPSSWGCFSRSSASCPSSWVVPGKSVSCPSSWFVSGLCSSSLTSTVPLGEVTYHGMQLKLFECIHDELRE